KRFIVVVGVALFFWGCEPKPNTSDLVKNMVVTTDYDNTVDFTKFISYYLPVDTISYFTNSSNQVDTVWCTGCSNNGGEYPHVVTSEVINKMNAAGFTQVGKKQNPDLRVYIFVVETVNVYQSYNYNPYGYGYGYGFGYGYGYGYPTYSETDQADLYLEIFDVKKLTNGKPTLLWYCDISDLVSSPDLSGLTTKAIDQAFKQSSYLKKQ
ncbi:MAG TPA: DUF4136 domain-containing protein, partial [Cyclobacteriaceae bacterium]|nr:DUF4136 domain-containing protein [Cyclobacteriaceae bacterium]